MTSLRQTPPAQAREVLDQHGEDDLNPKGKLTHADEHQVALPVTAHREYKSYQVKWQIILPVMAHSCLIRKP